MAELIEIVNARGEHLYIRYTPVEGSEDKPLAALLHGLSGSPDKPHNTRFAIEARQRGFSTLEIFARHSNSTDSYGELDDFTMSGHIEDLETAITWVEVHHPEWLNGQKPLIIGHSMGGEGVLESAANHQDKYSGIISLSAVASGQLFVDVVGDEWKSGDHQEKSLVDHGKSDLITLKNAGEWKMHDLFKCAAKIKAPVVCIAGGNDGLTPAKYIRALAAQIPQAHYIEVAGADHTFRNSSGELLVDDIHAAFVEAFSTLGY